MNMLTSSGEKEVDLEPKRGTCSTARGLLRVHVHIEKRIYFLLHMQ